MKTQEYAIKTLTTPQLMGIVNVTNDSFSDGGQFLDPDKALVRADELVIHGADIIDVGGESTRPGAKEVSEYTELKRVLPVLEKIRIKHPNITVSIDTRKARVAREALDIGVAMVNDISSLQHDPAMLNVLADYPQARIILMHMQGTPDTMQKDPQYDDVVKDIRAFFENRLSVLDNSGIQVSRILLDPGIGFGKSMQHNLLLLTQLKEFQQLGCPIVIGASRKSFISAIDTSLPTERLGGSIATALICAMQNVAILRVHDVQAHKQFFKVLQKLVEVSV